MPKNILIFSDGTGQVGGLRPDQHLSNIYKLYRATRTGPDSPINPAEQVAYYDAGLGSAEVSGGLLTAVEFVKKFFSSAFGTGLVTNVADCYEAILKHYNPGDRIYLFGFSRGAYTVRCLAGVLNLCGVPTKTANGDQVPRSGKALRAIADEAVHSVYEHGGGRPRDEFEDEREELARRFRVKFGSQDGEENKRGNVPPYFIGVFDTVAALGASGWKQIGMIAMIATLAGAAVGLAAIIPWLVFGHFWAFAAMIGAIALIVSLGILTRNRVKFIRDYPKQGDLSWHISHWRFKHYDRYLDPRVHYARHAMAIDETRLAFERVGWGRIVDAAKMPEDWLIQTWFAGNHSDIGGSYDETESRLSDIALQWMVDQCKDGAIPDGLKIDQSKLNLFGDPSGIQHCEVEAVLDRYPRWTPRWMHRSWGAAPREGVSFAKCHPTVKQRFEMAAVSSCGASRPYRPLSLKDDPDLVAFYSEA